MDDKRGVVSGLPPQTAGAQCLRRTLRDYQLVTLTITLHLLIRTSYQTHVNAYSTYATARQTLHDEVPALISGTLHQTRYARATC